MKSADDVADRSLTLFSSHHGKNRAALPQTWAYADKVKFKVVTENMLAYLRTCYSELPPPWLMWPNQSFQRPRTATVPQSLVHSRTTTQGTRIRNRTYRANVDHMPPHPRTKTSRRISPGERRRSGPMKPRTGRSPPPRRVPSAVETHHPSLHRKGRHMRTSLNGTKPT